MGFFWEKVEKGERGRDPNYLITLITVTLKHKTQGSVRRVIIEVHNLAGKLIDRFEGDTKDDETYWSFGDKLSNGVYIYRITISGRINKTNCQNRKDGGGKIDIP